MAVAIKLSTPPMAWELNTPEDLLEALLELAEAGWRGEIAAQHQANIETGVHDGPLEWSLELSAEQGAQTPIKAMIGDYLLLAGGILRKLTVEEWEDMVK